MKWIVFVSCEDFELYQEKYPRRPSIMLVVGIHFFAIILFFSIDNVAPDCGDTAGDIVFIVESSRSVGADNFDKIKEFLKATVDGFQIGSNNVRVGIVPFSASVYHTFQLTSFFSNFDLRSSISNIPYVSRSTNTAGAIRYARTISFGSFSRNHVPKIAVIITNGKSNNKSSTLLEAQRLRKNGVLVFSVGVGDAVNIFELQGMASKTSYVFDVSTFDALNSIRDKLAKETCEVRSCGHPGTPFKGFFHGRNFYQGTSVTFSCETGYKLVGNQQRTCQSNNVWSGSLPSCIFVNTCNINPCQNGGSCIGGENRYICNCIQGYTGVYCEKDIQPPITKNCPSEIRQISSSKVVNVTWRAPDFYDPFGQNVEVTTNYPDHGCILLWGKYTARYTAIKPLNGLRAYCTFNIFVEPPPCPNISAPLNGALVCNGWMKEYVRMCVVFCQIGTRPSRGHDLRVMHLCGGSGQWFPKQLPSCQKSTSKPSWREAFFIFPSCEEKHINRMKKGYISILRSSNVRSICLRYQQLCKAENVDVECNESKGGFSS